MNIQIDGSWFYQNFILFHFYLFSRCSNLNYENKMRDAKSKAYTHFIFEFLSVKKLDNFSSSHWAPWESFSCKWDVIWRSSNAQGCIGRRLIAN